MVAAKEVRKSMEQKKGWNSLSQTGNSTYRGPVPGNKQSA
jgi:hypothetical protein